MILVISSEIDILRYEFAPESTPHKPRPGYRYQMTFCWYWHTFDVDAEQKIDMAGWSLKLLDGNKHDICFCG